MDLENIIIPSEVSQIEKQIGYYLYESTNVDKSIHKTETD